MQPYEFGFIVTECEYRITSSWEEVQSAQLCRKYPSAAAHRSNCRRDSGAGNPGIRKGSTIFSLR